MHAKSFQLCVTIRTIAHQASLSMGFSRQEYWSGLSGPVSDPGMEPTSLLSPALAGRFFTTSTTWEAPIQWLITLSQLWYHLVLYLNQSLNVKTPLCDKDYTLYINEGMRLREIKHFVQGH